MSFCFVLVTFVIMCENDGKGHFEDVSLFLAKRETKSLTALKLKHHS